MKKHFFFWLVMCVIFVIGCQKELSFEGNNSPAKGSLQADISGDCLPKTVNGIYQATKPLVADSNTMTVSVNVITTGTYIISTDTVNGYFFRATGIFTTPGINSVKLRGFGTPFTSGTNNFVVSFDSTVCDIQVVVAQPGVGALGGSPTACAPISVNGAYSPGIALTSANNVSVQVNVTTPGNFIISTDTIAGIWFYFAGVISSSQTVVLTANGSIPAATATGNKLFTVKLGTSQCTFPVNVAGPAAGTIDCSGATFAGTYTAGQAMTTSNTVQLNATVTSTGVYSITSDTMNGVWFSGTGNFTTATTTPFTLTANGTPINSGSFTYTVKWGTSTCTFSQTYSPPISNDYFPRTIGSNWSYEFDDIATDSLYRTVISGTNVVPAGTFNIFMENDGTMPLPALDSSGYYRKSGGDYFEWVNLEDFGATTPVWIEYIMLKDNVAASTNWKTPSAGVTIDLGGTPTKIRFSNTILQKDVSISLTTSTSPTPVAYNNVIVVEQRIEAEFPVIGWQDMSASLGFLKSYYARGIGLIKVELTSPLGNSLQELRRYIVL